MRTENLAIREEVYNKLAQAKRDGESFSDAIERVLEKRGSILKLWGTLADRPGRLIEIEREAKKIRKAATVRA